MKIFNRSMMVVSGMLVALAGAFVACDDGGGGLQVGPMYGPNDPNNPNNMNNNNTGDTEGGTGGTGGEGGTGAQGDPAEILYRALQPTMESKCGGNINSPQGCHIAATAFANAPKFLAAPDSYKSIKAYNGIVVADVFSSLILTKGQHEGPSIFDDPDFSAKVTAWLNQESTELMMIKRPTTAAFSVMMNADNDVDLSSLANGVTGVHLKFHATLVGTSLSMTQLSLLTAAGSAVHIQHPVFYRVPAMKKNPADPDDQDPQDTFSNTDATLPGGATSTLPPGTAIFTGWDWAMTDKLRVEVTKLEKGTITEGATVAMCKNPTNFGSMVAPFLKGGGSSAPLNCAGCHAGNGNGVGAMDISGINKMPPDYVSACAAVLNNVVTTAGQEATSRIITKPATAGTGHTGGKVTNTAQWTTDMTGFIKGGTIF